MDCRPLLTFGTLELGCFVSNSSIMIVMDIKSQLNNSMKDAMKTGDEVRKRTTRMALANIKQAEVDKQTTLDEAAVISILHKEIKNRREAWEEAKKANRADLMADNEAEIKVLEAFIPNAMPAEELRALAQVTITEVGAASPSDMGKVMKALLPKVAGRAASDQVSAMVKELLAK